MLNIIKHTISEKETIKSALSKLNDVPYNLTLLVLNEKEQLIGTLTDGDIRRGLINGYNVFDTIDKVMSTDFYYINDKHIAIEFIRKLRHEKIKLLPKVNKQMHIIKLYNMLELKSLLPLDVVIMAGGRGARLKPLTDKIPKPLLKIGEKPIIEHNIDNLIGYGIADFHISVNYLKEQIIDYIGDGANKSANISYVVEDIPLGTIGSIKLIKKFQHNHILITNSDLFTNINYEALYFDFIENDADMAVASIPYNVSIPYAILKLEEDKIIGFKEKPSNNYYANAGIYMIKRELIDLIPENSFFNATDLLETCIKSKLKIIHSPIIGYWIDIGKHEDYQKAQNIYKHLKSNVQG